MPVFILVVGTYLPTYWVNLQIILSTMLSNNEIVVDQSR
jgi:hypothetical protein